MIKIPKSFDELKQIVSTVNIGDTLSKVQSTVNTAMDAAKPALVEGELGDIIEQLKKLHEQEAALLTRLANLTCAFQKQIAEAKMVQPVAEAPVSQTVTAAVAVESVDEAVFVSPSDSETAESVEAESTTPPDADVKS